MLYFYRVDLIRKYSKPRTCAVYKNVHNVMINNRMILGFQHAIQREELYSFISYTSCTVVAVWRCDCVKQKYT